MGEVEPQLVGSDVGAGLADVRAEPPAERGVQQVGGCVVALGGVPRGAVNVRVNALAPAPDDSAPAPRRCASMPWH